MGRRLSLLTALLLVFAVTPVGHASPRAVTADSVEVNLVRMFPLNPQPGGTLRMSGRLRNRSGTPVTAVQVRLLLSTSPMATRSEISTIAAGGADRDGPPTLAVSEPITAIAARSTVEWSIESPLDDLPLFAPGVYVVGLEVIGTGTDGLVQRLGLTRTFLPWYPEGSVTPSRLVWLWPVSSAPDRALDGVQLSERTAAEMAPGGRLDRLVTAVGDARVTWVFDPCLLQTADEMQDGYTVVSGPADSEPAQGSGAAVATTWLEQVREATADGPAMATPYAFPDATALDRDDMSEAIELATERASADVSAQIRKPVPQVLAWPAGGFTNSSTMRTFRESGATDLLLSDAAIPATPALTYTPDGFTSWSGMPVALADSGLSAALALPQDNPSQALSARQQFLAEMAMAAGELPDLPRSLIAVPDQRWSPRAGFLRQTLRALQQVPYAELVGFKAARREAVEVTRTRLPYPPEQRAQELSIEYLDVIKGQSRDARRLESILTEPSGVRYGESVVRQASAAWRADLQTGVTLVRSVSAQLASQISKVRVATAGTFTLPGDSGRIPVTVANDLDQDVLVGIRLESDEPARLSAPEIAPFNVPAGRKVSLEVEAKVVGSGTLPVKLQLTTPTGRRYGEPVTVQVRTTAYSRAAAYVVSGAFVLLAFLLGMNFVRRSKARHQDGS